MNKCFIECPKHKLYISYNDAFCYINSMLGKRDSFYYFVQFVYQIKNMLYGIKKAKKFKSKKIINYTKLLMNVLIIFYLILLCMIFLNIYQYLMF